MLLYEAAYEKQYKAQKSNVTFAYNLEHDLPAVVCDREQLLGAFRRLVDVVLLASPPDPPTQVSFSSKLEEEHVALSVQSKQSLLSARIADRISTFLEEAGESMLELANYGPTLTVVKNVISLHQGKICLNWQEDEKMHFKIKLPIHRPGEATATA
jgi:light-regulated signal transduction histidine kinase (bacteriophytochrome)